LCARRRLLPFFDVAYQGFCSGDLDADAAAPRLFVQEGLEVLVAQSYSKNLGLYGERVGAINAIVADKEVRLCLVALLFSSFDWSRPPASVFSLLARRSLTLV